MLAIFLVALVLVFAVFFMPTESNDENDKRPTALNDQLNKLWEIAQDSLKEDKVLKAEKALLAILRFDEKNAAAYNRLGILYARQRQFKEAIECFEIAQSLDSNASSLHNAGLIYLETGQADKAILAFEQALELESDLPNRYIAYAKALESVGNMKKAVEALENAYLLEKSPQTLRLIAGIHSKTGDSEGLADVKRRLEEIIESRKKKVAKSAPKKRRRLVM